MAKLPCNVLDVQALLSDGWSFACRRAITLLPTGLALLAVAGCSREDLSGIPRELTNSPLGDAASSQPPPDPKSEQPFQDASNATWRHPVRPEDKESQDIPLPPWAVQATARNDALRRSSSDDFSEPGSATRSGALSGTSTKADPAEFSEAADDQIRQYNGAGIRHAGAVGKPILNSAMPSDSSGDYSILLFVFAAPLVLLLPALWFWNLVRSYRAALSKNPKSDSIRLVH